MSLSYYHKSKQNNMMLVVFSPSKKEPKVMTCFNDIIKEFDYTKRQTIELAATLLVYASLFSNQSAGCENLSKKK